MSIRTRLGKIATFFNFFRALYLGVGGKQFSQLLCSMHGCLVNAPEFLVPLIVQGL